MKKISKTSNSVVSGLMDFLSESGQKNVLPEVTNKLQDLIRGTKDADKIIVTSFQKLDDDQLKQVKGSINNLIKINLPVINNIDKKIVGGFTVRVGDFFLDASLKKQLQNLKRELI